MGGDHTFYIPPKTASEAEDIFKKAVDEVREVTTEERVRNVFISFAFEDEAQVNLLRAQSKNPNFNMYFRDYSVKEPFDEKWKMHVRERIAQTSATIIMISEMSANSEPVNWEIEESYRQGKKVIAVRIYRDRDDPLPPALIAHNAPVINWDLDRINQLLQQD